MESLFPAECHFKVIALDLVGMKRRLNIVLAEMGITQEFTPGNRSGSGKYICYNASFTVDSHPSMLMIDKALRAIDGVKVVL